MKVHKLKILPEYFEAVSNGSKKFEIISRKDRDFQVGDILNLTEYDFMKLTGREINVKVTYILTDEDWQGIQKDWCVMSIERI